MVRHHAAMGSARAASKRGARAFATAAIAATGLSIPVDSVRAQHVTSDMATTLAQRTGSRTCEDRGREAAAILAGLNTSLQRSRQTGDKAQMHAAADAARQGLTDVTHRLEACREAKLSAGEVDHAAMGHGAPPLAPAAPATLRQSTGPAEDALQSFQDALQVGNREVALEWLAPDATVTEWGTTDASRDAYARVHMAMDMTFLKTAKIVIADRQVRPGAGSTRIVTTSRVTGRAGERPVDVTVVESALLRQTPEGWRIASLAWTVEPTTGRPGSSPPASPRSP